MEILSNYKIENCVFWVGAGISRPNPTALPLGWDLTKFALKETCGESVQNKVFEIWGNANQLAQTSMDNPTPLGTIPRLESILGEIDDVQKKLIGHKFNFLNGFSAFPEAPYNQNHFHLANLLHRGATIVTTNFDLCIQKAYFDLTNAKDQLTPELENGIYLYTSQSNNTVGNLWHIHGISKEITSLGATVRKVKEGIPQSFQQYLDKIFDEGKLVIFLGYSASDSFDVNIYFQNNLSVAKSNAIFIQHGDTKPSHGTASIGKGFKDFIIENHDTTVFLGAVSKTQARVNQAAFDWKNSFEKHIIPDEKGITRDFLTCKMANMFGISIDKIKPSAYQNSFQIEKYYETLDFHKTLAIVQRTRGDAKTEMLHDTTVKTKDSDLLGYYYAQGDDKKALEYAKSIHDLIFEADKFNTELDWSTYTSMSANCRPLVTKQLKSPFAKPSQDDLAKIKKLIKLTDILGNRPLSNVRFINQIATALRFNFIFKAIIGINDMNQEKTILHLYGEGASIVGFVSAFRDVATKNYFLAKHHRDRSLFRDAQKYADKSYRLANLIGDHSGMKRATRLINLFKVLSPLYW